MPETEKEDIIAEITEKIDQISENLKIMQECVALLQECVALLQGGKVELDADSDDELELPPPQESSPASLPFLTFDKVRATLCLFGLCIIALCFFLFAPIGKEPKARPRYEKELSDEKIPDSLMPRLNSLYEIDDSEIHLHAEDADARE